MTCDRQRDIENCNVPPVRKRELDGAAAVARLRAHFEILACFNRGTQTAAHDKLVVGKDDAHTHFGNLDNLRTRRY